MTDSNIFLIGSLIVSILSLLVAMSSLLHQQTSNFPKIKLKLIKSFDPYSDVYRYKYDQETKSLYLFAKFEVENYSSNIGSIHHCQIIKPDKNIFPLNKNQIDLLPPNVAKELNLFNVNLSQVFDKYYVCQPYQCSEIIFVFKLNSSCIAIKKKRFKMVYKSFDVDKRVFRLKFFLHGINFTNPVNFIEIEDSLFNQERKEVYQKLVEFHQRSKDAVAVNNVKWPKEDTSITILSKLLKKSSDNNHDINQ